jgi:hypothetical protein
VSKPTEWEQQKRGALFVLRRHSDELLQLAWQVRREVRRVEKASDEELSEGHPIFMAESMLLSAVGKAASALSCSSVLRGLLCRR